MGRLLYRYVLLVLVGTYSPLSHSTPFRLEYSVIDLGLPTLGFQYDFTLKRLGHSKPDITLRIYAHLFRKDDSKAADAINAVFSVS